MIVIDPDRARAVHRDRLRAARAPLLAALDAAFLRALEAGESAADIVARKQALRDAPAAPEIDAAAPDDLPGTIGDAELRDRYAAMFLPQA
ncbi:MULTISPECIES: hypothetical protein [Roseomonadaceae]|uniref:Uncharacterized protein n=1 Tax=Falsiroseomonas oleicola TaxID=2801474 RepID=A0ABS6H6D4_9PROT|nr:hypothetical protein [Roseomonas oleicola]MBU8544004.1 hypothetical protein [Roseomonas oleicola]